MVLFSNIDLGMLIHEIANRGANARHLLYLLLNLRSDSSLPVLVHIVNVISVVIDGKVVAVLNAPASKILQLI